MRVFEGFGALPAFVRPVVTIGSFDGVHRGHRELLGRVVALARETGGESVVITFDPHPREVLGNRGEPVALLNTLEEKALLIRSLGVDNMVVVPFTVEFSRIGPLEFVRDYLVGRVGVRHLVLGYDHHFGRGHEGSLDLLQRMHAQYGFTIHEICEQDVENHKVSSTVIRRLVREGAMDRAAQLLGYRYFLTVRAGEPLPQPKLLPSPGKYSVKIYNTGCIPSHETFVADVRLEITPDRGIALHPPVAGECIVEF